MTRAVHRLKPVGYPVSFIRGWYQEQIVLEVSVVTGHLPQIQIVDVWRDNFSEASFVILLPHHFEQFVVNLGTMHSEKGASGRILGVPEE